MSSEKRIAASRANGARSRGPKTPTGKARSSQNAITHGFYAQSVVILREDPAAFQQSRQAFLRRFAPSNPAELGLIDAMASAHWRGLRARRLEEEFCAAAGRSLCNHPSALRKLDLYSG